MTLDEQLNLIYDEVSRYLMIDNPFALNNSYAHRNARNLIEYIVKEGYPHLLKRYSQIRNVKVSSVFRRVYSFSIKLKYDVYLRDILDRIADDLENEAIRVRDYPICKKEVQKQVKTPSHTMVLFGFDYTPTEIKRRYTAMHDATIWFEKEYLI